MPSNAAVGAYYKSRTRKWFQQGGWQVLDLEIVRWVYRPGGSPIPVKRDQVASDLLLMSETRLVFVQVKGGQAASGQGRFPAAQRAFDHYIFPPFAERWIVAWAPRARFPRILVLPITDRKREDDGQEEQVPRRRQAAQAHVQGTRPSPQAQARRRP